MGDKNSANWGLRKEMFIEGLEGVSDSVACRSTVSAQHRQPGGEHVPYAYACSDFPGMAPCPGRFTSQTEAELWVHIESHAKIAHEEDPAAWGADDKSTIANLITSE
jgi:hypothetical protein